MVLPVPASVRSLGAALVLGLGAALPVAAQDFSDVVIRSEPLGDGLYVLYGRGGNMLASSGADGLLLVDDQYAPLAQKIRSALDALQEGPVRLLVNTHWHGDHVGGNEAFARAGALVMAHENVWQRMATEQYQPRSDRTVPPAPDAALPVVTHRHGMTVRWNEQTIELVPTHPAHTDGDTLVHFLEADVIHMGDVYNGGRFPFLDLASGGSVDGLIATCEEALARMDDDTRIVPGHGTVATRADLAAYVRMLRTVRERVAEAMADGADVDAVLATRPTRGFEDADGGFIDAETFVRTVHRSLQTSEGA
jgi:cyclase